MTGWAIDPDVIFDLAFAGVSADQTAEQIILGVIEVHNRAAEFSETGAAMIAVEHERFMTVSVYDLREGKAPLRMIISPDRFRRNFSRALKTHHITAIEAAHPKAIAIYPKENAHAPHSAH